MAEWTTAEQTDFTHLYEELKKGPDYGKYNKKADEQIFKGEQLPYKEAKSRLLGIIEEQKMEQHKGGLEHKVDNSSGDLPNLTQTQYFVGLVTLLGVVGALSVGLPPMYVPPLYQPLIL